MLGILMAPDRGRNERLLELGITAFSLVGFFFLGRHIITRLTEASDPDHEVKEQTKIKSAAILRRLDGISDGAYEKDNERPRIEELRLTQYEQAVLQDLVFPEDIPVSFEDIGGLGQIIEELRESVIYPLTMPNLYSTSSSLLSAPSGVLLYGPPGCGKTMLAKALAHESGACFINLHISTLTEKWFGDSNKLVNAVFSLARKLEPAIVFIDEIDAVLGTRRSGEHEASGMVKAEFMTHWDGLSSSNRQGHPQRIMILGATNRIGDIDEAILRRMPKKFPVTLPTVSQRLKILRLLLKDVKTDPSGFDVEYVARVTAGMSGSDLKEACRDAAMIPVREMIQAQRQAGQRMDQMRPGLVRGLRTEDFWGSQGSRKQVRSGVDKDDPDWQTESGDGNVSDSSSSHAPLTDAKEHLAET